jgi:hypothetical protein
MSLSELSIEAYLVPQFRISLLSVSQLAKKGYQTNFTEDICDISKNDKLVLRAREAGGLYRIDLQPRVLVTTRSMARRPPIDDPPVPQVLSPPSEPQNVSSANPNESRRAGKSNSLELWHRRLAHLNSMAMRKLLGTTAQNSDDHNSASCNVCIQAKHQQRFKRAKVPSSSVPFELIHSDLCGPIKHPSIGGTAYYIVYVDDCTKHTELYFLVGKSSDDIITKFEH